MNSFLNNLGFDPGFLVIGIMVLLCVSMVITIVTLLKYNKIQKNFDLFMKGRDGKNLEDIMAKIVSDNKKVKVQCKNNVDAILDMKRQLNGCYQKIGIVKYDTFRGMAGKLSFSVTLLDAKNSGFVMNCMHTQDGCYTYMKEIIHGEAHVVLSNEEKKSLNEALQFEII